LLDPERSHEPQIENIMDCSSFLQLPEELLFDIFALVINEQANDQWPHKMAPPFSQTEAHSDHPFSSVAPQSLNIPSNFDSEDAITEEWQMHRRLVALGKVREVL
jgi:hypothetical protein